jgi:hypothetical protein
MIISLDETKTLYELKKDLKNLQYMRDASAARLKAEEQKLALLRKKVADDEQRYRNCESSVLTHKDNRR